MTRKYFGTDGVRGKANQFPITADFALKLAQAAAKVLAREGGDKRPRVIIGKDTRLSGYMLEQAMCAGFISMGMKVTLVGPIPTPAIAMLTRSLHADLGVMISASHNPYQDNGIKLFGADGYKLDDAIEHEIETMIDEDLSEVLAAPEFLGRAERLDDAIGRYVEFLKHSLAEDMDLEGMNIVVDCAHGAAYRAAPKLLNELRANVHIIGAQPDGVNINDGVGATATQALQDEVIAQGADIGIALDGDADRLIIVDETGAKIDGDQLMGALALSLKERGRLKNNTLVATVMSNLGLERHLQSKGIALVRTAVGDRYVVEEMRRGEYNLGGEQSGHIVLSRYSTTGDGLLAALKILTILKKSGQKASAALNVFTPCPQVLKNVRYNSGKPMDERDVKAAIAKAEETLANDGRILVRASGTEPVIRVMAEGDDAELVESVVDGVCNVIQEIAGGELK